MTPIPIAIALAGLVAGAAYRARALNKSGALAAWAVGTAVFAALGWRGALVLLVFFISATAISRVGRIQKQALIDTGKHGPRDGMQVIANGGAAAACALLAAWFHAYALSAAFAGAFAAACADTWGTEIGTLARGMPRSILTLRRMPAGLSGGVTLAGTIAELGGAALVAATAALTGIAGFLPVLAGGFCGALADSILGASAQQLRYCERCARTCETDPHACGARTRRIRGVAWMNNDAVNLAATLIGALAAAFFSGTFFPNRG